MTWLEQGAGLRAGFAGMALIAYAAVVLAHNAWISPAYTAAGVYHPLLLAGGYFSVRALDERQRTLAWRGALGIGAALALWGLFQVGALGHGRATAMFETPSILGVLLAALAAPAALLWLGGRGSWPAALAFVLLVAGLVATLSRTAALALAGGAFFWAAVSWTRINLRRATGLVALTLAGVALGLLAFTAASRLPQMPRETLAARIPLLGELIARPAPPAARLAQSESRDSSVSRLELYAVSLDAWRSRPLAGTGYASFRHYLEQARAQVPSYGTQIFTYFVHNDYLQTLQELGPLGLAAFAAMLLVPLVRARLQFAADAERLAAAAGLTALATASLVDFPLYVPVCLLLCGAMIGTIERAPPQTAVTVPWQRAARLAGLAAGAYLVTAPVVAESSAWRARELAVRGEVRDALYWLEVGSRFQPSDWRYHWYLGLMWRDQALLNPLPATIAAADRAFEGCARANPLEPLCLTDRTELHRRLPTDAPGVAEAPVLERWSAQALALAPLAEAPRRERALVLERLGRRDEARRAALAWSLDEPGTPVARRIAARLSAPAGAR